MDYPQEGIELEFIRLHIVKDTVEKVQYKNQEVKVIPPAKIRFDAGSDVQEGQWSNSKIKRFGKIAQTDYLRNVSGIVHPYFKNN